MRIVIESAEQSGGMTPVSQPASSGEAEVMNGGAPSETLTAVTELPAATATHGEGMDGGSPPAWLLEAIEAVSQVSMESSGPGMEGPEAAADGGSAPSGG